MLKINLPLTQDVIQNLHAGDIVEISGSIYTARDAAHKKLYELLLKKAPLPLELCDCVIYYTGATPAKTGEPIGSCGPTTSSRMDKYTPLMLHNGVKGIIGKGGRNDEVVNAIKTYKAVYFVAIGGAGAFYKSAVKSCRLIAFPELLSEAVYKLEVEGFKVVVAIDSFGGNIFNKNNHSEI